MESLSRSLHRRKRSTAISASSSSSSFSLKNPYNDVLFSDGGKVGFGANEYGEIFSDSPSSIPVLDLSGRDERVGSDDSRSSKLDYPSIFSGLRDGEAAVSFDELLRDSPKKNETRNPGQVQSPDRESISRKTKMPSGDPPDPLPTDETNQHFSISFSKTSPPTNGDPSNGETHIAQLHAVPFTYFVDGSPRKAKKENELHCSSLLKREVSRTCTVGTEEVISAKDGLSIPGKAPVKSHNSSDIRIVSEHLPLLFNEESDENSLAALSAAALKKAVEQAEESIRIAKTIMERKKERFLDGSLGNRSKGLMSKERKKIRLENGVEKVRENVRVKANGSCARGETIGRMEARDGVDNNKGKCENESVEDEEVACDGHLKVLGDDLWKKSRNPVEDYVVEKEDGGNDYESAPDMKMDGSRGTSAEEEIEKRVYEVREVEADEKKPHFGHDGETLCKEFGQNNFSEAQNCEISRVGEETDYILDGNRDTFEFQGNYEAADSFRNNNYGCNETLSNDNMTISSESREQSDVDSINEAEEYQDDGPSGSKTENASLMNGHHEHVRTFADQTNEKDGHLEDKEEPLLVHELQESEENENAATSSKEEHKNVTETNKEMSKEHKDSKANEQKIEMDYQQQRIEAIKRGREREKDRIVVERAIREARERAFAEARERAERERAARERERAVVERATAEARERALEKARSQKTSNGLKQSFSSSDSEKVDGKGSESTQRRNARLERHQRTMERAAKALAEKNMRDFLAQKEQADRNRLAESLDADIKRWVRGKEGNLRVLLSTLQYILGPDSGWQPVSLTEIITTTAVKKTYRKATLCVHPDKLQQRGANIQQKYICEKVFDLLKAAWNRFNSEER